MNKKLYILSLLSALMVSNSWCSWGSWWQSKFYLSAEDARSAEGFAQDALDHFLKPGLQNSALKRDIENFTARKKQKIRKAIEDAAQHDPNITHRIKDEARARAQEAAKQFMTKKIEELAIKHLHKFGFTPNIPEFSSLLYKTESTLSAEIARLNANNSSFAYLLQNLESKVAASVDKEVKQLPAYQPYYDQPSAPNYQSKQKKILEVFPDNQSERNKVYELIEKTEKNQKGGMEQGKRCYKCNLLFTEIGNRVNLPCGHAKICAQCYVDMAKPQCPICHAIAYITYNTLKNAIDKSK